MHVLFAPRTLVNTGAEEGILEWSGRRRRRQMARFARREIFIFNDIHRDDVTKIGSKVRARALERFTRLIQLE
jgi:hypothetical protein